MLLVLDTCFAACSAALFDGRVIASRFEAMERGHAEVLPVIVETLLRERGIKASALTRIAVTIGPGSFTGVRIGLSFARGMALARGLPIVGVDSLWATAAPLFDVAPVLVAHHAGNSGQVFVARYARGGKETEPPKLASLDPAFMDAEEVSDVTVVGTAAHLFENRKRSPEDDLPNAARFAPLADQLTFSSTPPEPLYLRAPDAKPQSSRLSPVIRAVTSSDISTIAKLHRASFKKAWTEDQFAAALDLKGAGAFCIEADDAMRGFVHYQIAADEAEIHAICVEPRWRKRGLAGMLLASLVSHLRTQNMRALFLEVASGNAAALKLYEPHGFQRVGLRKSYYADTKQDAVLMRLALK